MRLLFFLVVLVMLAGWVGFYLRPLNRRASNILYIAAAVLAAITLAGWLRVV